MKIKSIEKYQELLEQSSEIITLIDTDGTFRYQSPSVERILGYEPNELVGNNVIEYVHPEDRDWFRNEFRDFAGTDETVSGKIEYRFRNADGSWVWLESTSIRHDESDLQGIVVNSRDISQRKSQEIELERQANRLELFSVAFPDIAFIIDEEGVYRDVLAGKHSEELLFENPTEIIGQTSEHLLPSDLGQTVTEKVQETIASGEVRDFEYSLEVSGSERWFEARVERLPFELAGKRAVIAVVRDISDRKNQESELGNLAEELEVLTRVVRHDIRNDMGIVLGWAQLLEDHVDDDGKEILEKILASGEHIVELTDIARDYVHTLTQPGDMDMKPAALRSVLRTEIDLRRESYPEAEFIVTGEIPNVTVKANDMLSAVFRNILNNAVQHNKRDNPEVIVSANIDDGAVVVQFTDNGPGIPDTQKETVFGQGEKSLDSSGTGIGLYLVRTLVEQWDGSVHVHDNEPTGSVFEVRLLHSE